MIYPIHRYHLRYQSALTPTVFLQIYTKRPLTTRCTDLFHLLLLDIAPQERFEQSTFWSEVRWFTRHKPYNYSCEAIRWKSLNKLVSLSLKAKSSHPQPRPFMAGRKTKNARWALKDSTGAKEQRSSKVRVASGIFSDTEWNDLIRGWGEKS